ncbi:MAG: flagellar motor switch protein FliG [Candidatus Omnitrophica bacterium]|nr:flagellar motor switch protein FliG [Candidatus Omnitrophota bacterium]
MVRRSGDGNQGVSGRRKAAILLLTLGPDVAAAIYKNLTDLEIEQITVEIATMDNLDIGQVNHTVEEFYHTAMAQQYISQGGIGKAQEILERAVGSQRALEIIGRLQGALQVSPFDFVRRVEPEHLLSFIQGEHPQTIALILSHLPAEQAASIISGIPPEQQAEVALRIATMDQTAPEITREVERVLERKIAAVLSQDFTMVGGVEALAELLNRVDRTTERSIMETIEAENAELADSVKKLMFVFEDIILLDDRAIQQVLKEVDQKELAMVMKGSSDEVSEKVFSNMSARAAEIIKEDMEFMGPVRLRQVEEAQQRVVSIIRRLEESGEITITRGEEDLVV